MAKHDWHPEDIKAAIRKRGRTVSGLAIENGYSPAAVSAALREPCLNVERAVAAFIGVPAEKIWPSRYRPTQHRKRARRAKGDPRPRTHVDVASRLREAVSRIGTQAQAAAVAGVSERQVRKYLAGKATPSHEVFWRLGLAGRLRPDWLRTGGGVPQLGEVEHENLVEAVALLSKIEPAVHAPVAGANE